jgi:restriction system protein
MMDPFKFEELIKFLLEEMDYSDVQTTSPVNDKGVDVVADIEFGISSVREVIQVKRHKGNINRTVLDQLRGSLHRFDAVRGTIITTGGFSKGTVQAAFERGAAPITLIDGEKLLDLLIQHEIGVSKNAVEYIEFDASKLAQFESDEAEEPEVQDLWST